MSNEFEELGAAVVGKIKKAGLMGVIGLAGFITAMDSFYIQEGGEISIIRSPSGVLSARMEPGVQFKLPYVSKVHHYNDYITVAYSDNEESSASSDNPPYRLSFGDTYSGKISASFRFRMPQSEDKFIELHKAVMSQRNLIGNTLVKGANQLMQYTAAQFTGVELMQGGANEYRNRIMDQAEHGLYVTKRQLVIQESDVAKAGVGVDNTKVTTGQSTVYKNVIMRDKAGKALRTSIALDKYGITLAQLTVEEFVPNSDLEKYATDKRDRLKARIRIVEEQENERQRAKTAEAKGERERIEAKQNALRAKDQAEIAAKQQLALEKISAQREKVKKNKEKDLAAIQKAKELEIAQKEEAIQKANAKAANFKASALRQVGLAEAAVVKAKNDAIDFRLYQLEKETEQVVAKARAVAAAKIVMPQQLFVGGNGKTGTNSMDALMDIMTQQRLDELSKSKK